MRKGRKLYCIPLILLCVFVWWPLWFMLMGALQSAYELKATIGPALGQGGGWACWTLLPSFPTLQPLTELLLDTPRFFTVFWNTCLLAFPQVLGQLLAAAPAAWAFSRLRFRGKRSLFLLYIVLMLMPFQVTMAPGYFVFSRLKLMDTVWVILLPGIFSCFPVFIMTRSFDSIPRELLEAAKLDGASQWQIFIKIALPLGRPGILAALVLGFLESWSAVEQPMNFLKNQDLWPLSLFLPNITWENLAFAMGASLVALMPAVVIFRFGQKYLELGIQSAGTVQ